MGKSGIQKDNLKILKYVLICLIVLIIASVITITFVYNFAPKVYIMSEFSNKEIGFIKKELNIDGIEHYKVSNCAFQEGFQDSGTLLVKLEIAESGFEDFESSINFYYNVLLVGKEEYDSSEKPFYVRTKKDYLGDISNKRLNWWTIKEKDRYIIFEGTGKDQIVIYVNKVVENKRAIFIEKQVPYFSIPEQLKSSFKLKIF